MALFFRSAEALLPRMNSGAASVVARLRRDGGGDTAGPKTQGQTGPVVNPGACWRKAAAAVAGSLGSSGGGLTDLGGVFTLVLFDLVFLGLWFPIWRRRRIHPGSIATCLRHLRSKSSGCRSTGADHLRSPSPKVLETCIYFYSCMARHHRLLRQC